MILISRKQFARRDFGLQIRFVFRVDWVDWMVS